jgi:hypothetical protein
MKTYQCKKSLLAVGLAVALASPTALASVFDSGLVNDNGEVHFDITATVASVVQIKLANESDVDLGEYNPLSPIDSSQPVNDVCLYSNTGSIIVDAESANSADAPYGDLVKAGGGPDDVISYHLKLYDAPTVAGGSEIDSLLGLGATGSLTLTDSPIVASAPCDGTSTTHLASFEIVPAQVHTVLPTAGSYLDTLTLTVHPG